jgi:hypothetical protein
VQRRSVANLVGESPTRGNCPVDAVVITGSGPRVTVTAESPVVNVTEGWLAK